MAKLPHTAGGVKGEGGVPPAENDAGERDGGDEEGEEGEEEEGLQRALIARRTASPPCVPSPLELKVADGGRSPHAAPTLLRTSVRSISIGARGHNGDGSGRARFDSAAWVLDLAMLSSIRPPGPRYDHAEPELDSATWDLAYVGG